MVCNELSDETLAITAIPIVNDLEAVVNTLTPTITVSDDYFNAARLAGAITVGAQSGALIPMIRRTGRSKDDESDGVAGRLHTVTVTCDVDSRVQEIWGRLLALERAAHHLLLTFRSGNRAFVRATRDGYQCRTDRDGAKTSITFSLQNWMGVQMIV